MWRWDSPVLYQWWSPAHWSSYLVSRGHIYTHFIMYLPGPSSRLSHPPRYMHSPCILPKLMLNSFFTMQAWSHSLGEKVQAKYEERTSAFLLSSVRIASSVPDPVLFLLAPNIAQVALFLVLSNFLQASALSRVLSPHTLLRDAVSVHICFRVGWCVIERHICRTTKLEIEPHFQVHSGIYHVKKKKKRWMQFRKKILINKC